MEIVVVDAGCDPKYRIRRLERAIRIIRNDFNAEIEITDLPTAESIKATKKHQHSARSGTGTRKDPAIGTHPLHQARPGWRRATRRRSLRRSRSIAKGEPFPHQSTADQFFDEPQFESYRALGQYSVKDLPAMALEVVYPIEACQGQLAAQPSTAANAAATSAAPSGSKTSAAGEEKKTRGFGEALSGLVSWDKLPGLRRRGTRTAPRSSRRSRRKRSPHDDGGAAGKCSRRRADATVGSRAIDTTWLQTVEVSWNSIRCRGFGEGQLCRKAGPTCDDGARLSKAMIRKLAALNTKLAECGSEPRYRTAAFTVRGYASTSEFSMTASGFVGYRRRTRIPNPSG